MDKESGVLVGGDAMHVGQSILRVGMHQCRKRKPIGERHTICSPRFCKARVLGIAQSRRGAPVSNRSIFFSSNRGARERTGTRATTTGTGEADTAKLTGWGNRGQL